MKKIALISLIASSVLMAGGWKIPETSTNAVALGAANVAHNHNNADAAYYNPAKMTSMSDENHIDANLMYIGLEAVKYSAAAGDIESEKEKFLVPSLHYVSPTLNKIRLGLSITSPGGLSKRWKTAPAVYSAEEFSLKILELNPSIAVAVNDKFSVAVGVRALYSEGIVKSTHPGFARDMKGDSIDYGYNLALAYQPTKDIEIGVTYRSKVDLTERGNAKLSSAITTTPYDIPVSVTVPLPASLNIALAYTFSTKTTLELVYERTYWSAYKDLDFQYNAALADAILTARFDDPVTKNWKDSNTFRLGITQEYEKMAVMAGVVIDETPTPNDTLGFEYPGSDAVAVSLGTRYKLNDKMDISCAALYAMSEKRTVNNSSINGTFSDANALLLSVGLGYKF